MSVLCDVMPILCVVWLLCAGQTVSHNNVTPGSKHMELQFQQAQDLASIMEDVKTMMVHQSEHYHDLKTQADHLREILAKMNDMTDMISEVKGIVSDMKTMTADMMMLQSEHYRGVPILEFDSEPLPRRASCVGNPEGLNRIYVDENLITVPCDGQGWIVMMRRVDGKFNFPERTWEDYKNGFGDPDRSFWLGLEKIHHLTSSSKATLRVELESFDGETRHAEYEKFEIEAESKEYELKVSGYSGTAGDSLEVHDGMKFSTKERDHDKAKNTNCAEKYKGAWWYKECQDSNLNSVYSNDGSTPSHEVGLIWVTWKGSRYSYKTVTMKIRL